VLRDPRLSATDADLRAQYDLATRVAALRANVTTVRAKAEQHAKQLSGPTAAAYRRDVIGEAPPDNPDDSEGVYSHDLSSFRYLENQLDNLEGMIESADAAPTPDMRSAYDKLSSIYQTTLAHTQENQ
jgi:hypothetical protein